MNSDNELKPSSKKPTTYKSAAPAADDDSSILALPAEASDKSVYEVLQTQILPSCLYLEPMIHEDQSLQLCALHTINNLLQLKERVVVDCTAEDTTDSVVLKEALLCGGRLLYSSQSESTKNNAIATIGELNQIADYLTERECSLLAGGDTSMEEGTHTTEQGYDVTKNVTSLSLLQKMRSQHRTLLAGNYSFEVLETILSQRNVSLKWFPTDQHSIESLETVNHGNNNINNNAVIGFILNATDSSSSIWNSIVHSLFGGERHWFAITRLRRCWIPQSVEADDEEPQLPSISTTTNETETLFLDSETDAQVEYDSDLWHIVDSDSSEIVDLTTKELWDLLKEAEEDGGTLLQAILNEVEGFRIDGMD